MNVLVKVVIISFFARRLASLRLESPRLYHCQCESDGRTSFSPLAETAKRSNGWWRNSKPVDCGGVNFVRRNPPRQDAHAHPDFSLTHGFVPPTSIHFCSGGRHHKSG